MSLKIKPGTAVVVAPTPVQKIEPKVSFVQKVVGGDTYLVMAQSAVELEDEFANLYFTVQYQARLFLQPPFDPQIMLNLTQTNNTLSQCVEVMEVNIDGTGHEFVKSDDDKEMDAEELKLAKSLFDEPYPRNSFVKIRRKLRREIESVGYGYLEVLRTVAGKIAGFRNLNSHNVRMVKLDTPVLVTKTMVRSGEEVSFQMWERERRFGQRVAMSNMVYYREFGTTRQVHRETGNWEDAQNLVPVDKRATELLMVGLHPDVQSPYFVPRWVNQMPSVVGSRKAEEQNLEFFDAGGMPPAIIFIQGGVLAGDAADQLRNYLSGKNKNKYRAVVVEAQSSSGSMDSSGTVQVKVERFGGEKANDALYKHYDETAGEHVRKGFRIPPLFLGEAKDHNFATAVASYMVAEAQVFKPERALFDELINTTILRELGIKTLKLKSLPITLQDVANQMKALELSKDSVERDSFIDSINAVTGLHLVVTPPPPAGAPTQPGLVSDGKGGHDLAPAALPAELSPVELAQEVLLHSQAAANDAKAGLKPGATAAAAVEKNKLAKVALAAETTRGVKKSARELIDLAQDYAAIKGLVQKRELSEERQVVVKFEIDCLEPSDMQAFNELLASYTFGSTSPDLVSLAACAHTH